MNQFRKNFLIPFSGIPTLFASCGFLLMGAPVRGQVPALTTVRVGDGLDSPTFVTFAPGDFDRIFVAEKPGRIRVLRPGSLEPFTFLDLTAIVSDAGEGGLIGLVFDPAYADNGTFYVNYTDNSGNLVLAAFRVSNDPDQSETTGEEILTIAHPSHFHNAGWIDFGPRDGYLYIATGDPGNFAQDPQSLLGKMLRLDVHGDDFPTDSARNYAIPPDNPFVSRAGRDEIWAYGLRNPWRCAFDRWTGELFIADVGSQAWEEIDVQPAAAGGENYGWPCMEGHECRQSDGGDCVCDSSALTLPVYQYTHDADPFRCAIIGGEVYRGLAIPELGGTYFFADYCSNQIWSFRMSRGIMSEFVERTDELDPPGSPTIRGIISFGRDAAGELYLCDSSSGEVFKIVKQDRSLITSSNPPDGAIDARRPLDRGLTTPVGWDELTLIFDTDADGLLAASLVVSQQGGEGSPPTVASVERLDARRVKLLLSGPIQPAAWTTITHVDSGASVRLGFLPGDVDGNRCSNPSDILALIDALNGVGPVSHGWSLDIDRSGVAAPVDILELVDLFIGAGGQPAYLGAELP